MLFQMLEGLWLRHLAPFIYERISDYIISLAGVISLIGLGIAAPILFKEWKRLSQMRS
jgi:hypothetical protein